MAERDSTWGRFDASGWPLLAARLALGGVFVAMGWSKWHDPVAFLKALRAYDLFPAGAPWLMNATAAALPGAEILCGLLVLAGVALRGTALFLGAMLVVFTVAIAARAAALAELDSVALCAVSFDCGCGSGVQNACRKLVENAGLLVACVVLLVSRSRRACLRARLLGGGA